MEDTENLAGDCARCRSAGPAPSECTFEVALCASPFARAHRCACHETCCLQVIEVDVEWRQLQFKVDNLRAEYGKKNKEVAAKKKAKEDADDLIAEAKTIDASIKVTA